MNKLQIDLSGRIAVVTGGAGQLGRVMVRTLAACGADVAVHYFSNREGADQLAGEAREQHGVRAIAVHADVTRQADVLALRDRVLAELGPADIIVNNAVAQYPWKPTLEQPIGDFVGQFESSVLHNVLMAQAFVPAMAERKWGRVIGINTECAYRCDPTEAAYDAGKRGMDGVLRVLAKEVGPAGVTVNQVVPGWTISDEDREAGTERQPEYEKTVPLRRRGTDQEIANAVAFLASDLAGFITGVYLPVTGGTVMPGI